RVRVPARPPDRASSRADHRTGNRHAGHRQDARVNAMTPEDRKKLIDQYNDGYRVVAEALTGADEAELDARPAPGKWTAREVVHHLADSEMTAGIRLRLLLAMDNPAIQGYDQDEF